MNNKKSMLNLALASLVVLPFVACGQAANTTHDVTHTQVFKQMSASTPAVQSTDKLDTATFAAGCYWCVDAQFTTLKGVVKVVSGFEGGHMPNPTYQQVCTGKTGYAETANIIFNPSVISYSELLAAFFVAHDPTQLNRQGNDVGTQYRSAIFYHNDKQKDLANYYINKLDEVHAYPSKIVTEVTAASHFYPADKYHQGYYLKHPDQPYCELVIQPEVEKFKMVFKDKIKTN